MLRLGRTYSEITVAFTLILDTRTNYLELDYSL
jgi:hypothetical protein